MLAKKTVKAEIAPTPLINTINQRGLSATTVCFQSRGTPKRLATTVSSSADAGML
jgi:hypothetical protein